MTGSGDDNDNDAPVLHRTLARLLRRHKLTQDDAPSIEAWQSLLADVSANYNDDDSDRKMLERSVEISSRELQTLNKRLTKQASTDAMTGLLNRSSLMAELEHYLGTEQPRDSNILGLLFIDLDGFKLINDRLGHAVGDELLRIVAERLRNCVRSTDLVARFGGDEFVILVPSISNREQLIALADRIVFTTSQTICLSDTPPIGVGASVGVAAIPGNQKSTAERLLIEADLAMYSAKTNGRNRVVVFTPDLESSGSVLSIAEELRDAIINDELVLHYQPLVCMAHERVVAMEALVRWNHPERGMIPPDEFIPVAESSGLIHDLTRLVLTKALNALSTWPSDLLVSVNLSPKDFAYRGTIDVLREHLDKTGVDSNRVILEITENTLVTWDDTVIEQLQSMLDTGIHLAIDDFGRGYSSLSQLIDLPFQIVKLDRKFVESVSELEASKAIVRTVVELARTLGLTIVAEGIETADQAAVLRQLGCDIGQGYYFGRPVADPVHDDVGCLECTVAHLGLDRAA